MDNITLGQIKDVVVWGSVVIGAIGVLYKLLMSGIDKILTPMKEDTKRQLDEIKEDLKIEKKQRITSELTTFMYLAENNQISDEQKRLAHEEYDEYIKIGNSYIKHKFDMLVKEGKI